MSSDETTAPHRLTLRYLIHEAATRFFNLERGWLRTARELTTGPGAMIRRYVEHDRKSYANPVSYLVAATAVSLVIQSVTGFQKRFLVHMQAQAIQSPGLYEFVNEVQELIFRNILYVSFALLIPFAILMRWLCRKSGFNLAESFVFAFFAGGHMGLLGIVLIVTFLLTSMHPQVYAALGLSVGIAYYSYAAVGFYGGKAATVVKTILAFLAAYVFLLVVVIIVTVLYIVAVKPPSGEPWDLIRAADGNVVAAARTLLEDDGADVDMTLRRTALHAAAEKGYAEMVELLLEHGADVDVQDHLGRVPMFLALARGHLEVARRLAEAGTDATVRTTRGTTLLYMAVERRAPELARWSLEHGVDVDARRADSERATALMAAAAKGDLAMVELLLEHGADPSVANDDGETALDVAKGKEVEERLRGALTPGPS